MDYQAMSDKAIGEELGGRLKARRLRADKTQEELAGRCGLSLSTIQRLEAGNGKLSSLIAVLRELNCLQELDSFIPPVNVSPIQMMKAKGKTRQRASRKASSVDKREPRSGRFRIMNGQIVPRKDENKW